MMMASFACLVSCGREGVSTHPQLIRSCQQQGDSVCGYLTGRPSTGRWLMHASPQAILMVVHPLLGLILRLAPHQKDWCISPQPFGSRVSPPLADASGSMASLLSVLGSVVSLGLGQLPCHGACFSSPEWCLLLTRKRPGAPYPLSVQDRRYRIASSTRLRAMATAASRGSRCPFCIRASISAVLARIFSSMVAIA